MSTVLYYIIPFIVVLGVLIFFHESGHFILSKLCKVKVLKFSLGFGPKIIGKTVGEFYADIVVNNKVIVELSCHGQIRLRRKNQNFPIAPS